MKREEAMKLVEQGIAALNRALRAGQSEQLQEFLSTLARFHRYSFGNAVLIWTQRPDATRVAGFHAWRKLGRWVQKGEQGIAILAPMACKRRDDAEGEDPASDRRAVRGFRVAYVFDVSQTDGTPLPDFSPIAGEPRNWLKHLEDVITDAGVQVDYNHIAFGALGCSTPGRIQVRPDLEAAETFSVLAHEFAHELLHQRTERKEQTNRQLRETEAEAVAHAVCLACGIDSTTRSSDYIQLYQGTEELLGASLTLVQRTAAEIITQLHAHASRRTGYGAAA